MSYTNLLCEKHISYLKMNIKCHLMPKLVISRSAKVMTVGKSVYCIYSGFLKMFPGVMFTHELHYYLMDVVPNVCTIWFPCNSNNFDQIRIWQRSPKVMKVGKYVHFIYPWFIKMLTVVNSTNQFDYYLMDMVPNVWSI